MHNRPSMLSILGYRIKDIVDKVVLIICIYLLVGLALAELCRYVNTRRSKSFGKPAYYAVLLGWPVLLAWALWKNR